MKKAGYATNKQYPELLIKIILFDENNTVTGVATCDMGFANLSGIFSNEFSGIVKLKKFNFEKIFKVHSQMKDLKKIKRSQNLLV